MKKRFFSICAVAALLFVGYSCSTEENGPADKQNQAELSFAFMEPADMETRTADLGYQPWKEYTECKTGFDPQTGKPLPLAIGPNLLLAHIQGVSNGSGVYATPSFNEYLTISARADGSWVTQTITVDAGKSYKITGIEIVDKATKGIVYYSGVAAGATFAPYVGATLPQTFTVENAFTKPIVDLWVLCARGRNPKDFGKPKFDLNRVEVSCIPVFVDVCNKTGEEFVADGTIKLQKIEGVAKPDINAFTGKPAVTDDLKSGQISYVCFGDNLDIDDAKEWYLITIDATAPDGTHYLKQAVFSITQLKDYVHCPLWDATYGYIDVLLCDDCATRAPLNEGFEYTSIANLQARGWTGLNTTDMNIASSNGNPGKYMIIFGNDNHGTDNYTIVTEKFKYTQGHKIIMDLKAYFKKECKMPATTADVKVKVTLIKDAAPVYFGTATLPVNDCNEGQWVTKPISLACPQTLATDCYTMQLDIEMPGKTVWIPCVGNVEWYDVYNFGLDNLKNGF